MTPSIPRILTDHKSAVLEEWTSAVRDKFAHLEKDTETWLSQELEDLYSRIVDRLESDAASSADLVKLKPELLDSMEFASRIECLISGMRCIVRFVEDLFLDSAEITPELCAEIRKELEMSFQLQLHDEVKEFCARHAASGQSSD